MVEIPTEQEKKTSANTGWWFAGLFTVAAMLGLWWAQIQQTTIQDVSASTFTMPTARWILWSLTMLIVGVSIGLAVASAAGWREKVPMSGLLWGLVPLTPVISLHLWINGVVSFPVSYLRVAISIGSQVACSIFVGIFVAALLAPALPASTSVEQQPSPEGA